MDRYKIFLFFVFTVVWILAAVNPIYPDTWLYENILVFIFVPIIIFTGRYFKLSNVSYTLITIFMVVHLTGAHYSYSEVPFGFTLQEFFNESRNTYDRFAHFFFGFLLAYPMREIVLRLAKTKGIWSFYFPLSIVVALSALYEVVEWLAVRTTSNFEASLEFLGMQGDMWDAQKDMVLAFLGAVLALVIVAFLNRIYNREFGQELKESLKIEKGEMSLGEAQMQEWIKKKTGKIKKRTSR